MQKNFENLENIENVNGFLVGSGINQDNKENYVTPITSEP